MKYKNSIFLSVISLILFLINYEAYPDFFIDEGFNVLLAENFSESGVYNLKNVRPSNFATTGPFLIIPLYMLFELGLVVNIFQLRLLFLPLFITNSLLFYAIIVRLTNDRRIALTGGLVFVGSFFAVSRLILGEFIAIMFVLLFFMIEFQKSEKSWNKLAMGLLIGVAYSTKGLTLGIIISYYLYKLIDKFFSHRIGLDELKRRDFVIGLSFFTVGWLVTYHLGLVLIYIFGGGDQLTFYLNQQSEALGDHISFLDSFDDVLHLLVFRPYLIFFLSTTGLFILTIISNYLRRNRNYTKFHFFLVFVQFAYFGEFIFFDTGWGRHFIYNHVLAILSIFISINELSKMLSHKEWGTQSNFYKYYLWLYLTVNIIMGFLFIVRLGGQEFDFSVFYTLKFIRAREFVLFSTNSFYLLMWKVVNYVFILLIFLLEVRLLRRKPANHLYPLVRFIIAIAIFNLSLIFPEIGFFSIRNRFTIYEFGYSTIGFPSKLIVFTSVVIMITYSLVRLSSSNKNSIAANKLVPIMIFLLLVPTMLSFTVDLNETITNQQGEAQIMSSYIVDNIQPDIPILTNQIEIEAIIPNQILLFLDPNNLSDYFETFIEFVILDGRQTPLNNTDVDAFGLSLIFKTNYYLLYSQS